jgi:tyrosine-protein phosphatase YwqE
MILPEDVVHHILLYIDTIKYRNGKYMNQISKNDKRYELLRRIPRMNVWDVNVYEIFIYGHVYDEIIYKSTNTAFYVDLENDTITYTFCYDVENNPDIYYSWIRN